MKEVLINGLSPEEYQAFCNENGRENINSLLRVMEEIDYVCENPMESVYWLSFCNARHDGVQPNTWKFPSIIYKYFPMSFHDFLTVSCDDSVFDSFENECMQSCTTLQPEQVAHAHSEALYLYQINKEQETVV